MKKWLGLFTAVVLLACLPAVGLYWRAATTIRADIERAAHA